MSKTTSIYTRVEPQLKEEAEKILSQLGIPMSNAINIFLRQVVLQKGLPFEVKISPNTPLEYGELTPDEFNFEIEKGFKNLEQRKTVSADLVAERMQKEYDREI